ncbi:MAG TPA: D-glycerate dehydrogenase [Jatrophihabitans sp.]|nr:D-glycerate dehydrogenase [Jatrophihabitans sp.]
MTLTVLITQPIHPEAVVGLRAAGARVRLLDSPEPVGGSRLAEAAAGADVLITLLTDTVDAGVFRANPGLRLVANVAVGHDNIDLAAARAAGVLVTNTPGVLTEATADHTMALLLSCARRVAEGDRQLREGLFTGWTLLQEPMGSDVTGRTLGVVGMGRIGLAVARRASLGFGMPLLYSGHRVVPAAAELGARRVPLDELLAAADFITLHAPLTPETRHLIDDRALRLCKPSAILVNTSRGPLVDEAALARALAGGLLAGAALDVFEHEPAVHPELLARTERVLLTPHLGSATDSTRRRMSALAVASVVALIEGREPANRVG